MKVYFTMVCHPGKGWIRVGNAYRTRAIAAGWLPFVRGAWKGCRVRVSELTLRYVDGDLDERTRQTLDRKFNLDPRLQRRIGTITDRASG
jgi:hypothetical protein